MANCSSRFVCNLVVRATPDTGDAVDDAWLVGRFGFAST